MEIIRQVRFAGQPTDTLPEYFAREAWENVPVLQARPFEQFFKRHLAEIESIDRCEYIAKIDDRVIGAMVFSKQDDISVGDCLYVLLAYSGNPKALTSGYRWLMKCAKNGNIKWVITTHLLEGTDYKTRHIPIGRKK